MNPVEFLGSTGLVLRGEVGGSDGWPSVLLLHGGGQTHHSWSALAHQLVTAGYRVISYDARGHGDSDWALDGDYTLDALAADLNCVVRKIGRPVAVVGASVGGLSGFWQTAHHPESVAALVLVDIALRPAPEGTERILEFMRSHRDGFESLAAAAKAVADFNPHRKTTGSGSNLMRNLRRAENGQLQWHWDPALLSTGEEHYRNERFERLAAVSDRITAPTLLVRGQRSDIVGTREVEQMRELIPHLEVREVEGAGHMVVGDSNDTFAHCIIAFLRHHYPRGAGSNR